MQNVVLVVVDTARADGFEPYGATVGTSPAVGQLGRRGVVVDQAIAPSSWTLPSHASMFTGRLPRDLGLGQAPFGTPAGAKTVIDELEQELLPSVLRARGYVTRGVSNNLWVSPHSGLDQGFDSFDYVVGRPQGMAASASWRSRLSWDLESVRAKSDAGASAAEQVVEGWLRETPDAEHRPFFWFVNLIECHSPYLPPTPYNDLGPLARLRAGRDARQYLTLESVWRACLGVLDIPASTLDRMHHLHRCAITYVDEWLARLFERLDAKRLLDDTIVIITSDHGENFGEGHLFGHCFSLDNRLTRVPFVAAGPGVHHDGGVFSLVDLPRLLDTWLGNDDHPWPSYGLPAGTAVAQLDRLAAPTDPHVLYVVESWNLDQTATHRLSSDISSATDGHWKLVRSDHGDDVYDLSTDPLELAPVGVGGEDASVVASLRRALDVAAAHDGPRPAAIGEATSPVAEVTDEEAEQLANQMRLLGYLD